MVRRSRILKIAIYPVSDQGPKFITKIVNNFSLPFSIQYKPNVAYFRQVNGANGRLITDIIWT